MANSPPPYLLSCLRSLWLVPNTTTEKTPWKLHNCLFYDWFSNLNYQVVKREEFPLYTWLLVDLPPGPIQKPDGFLEKMKKAIDKGVQYAAGGLASKVADQAIKYANRNEENHLEQEDTYY